MSSQPTPQIILSHFNWSLARLKEAIENESTEYYRGTALHRFSLTYDVALETIRAFAREQGQVCSTEEDCFQWVKEKQWLEKKVDCNFIKADYQRIQERLKAKEAEKIYDELQTYYMLLNHLNECMKLA